MTAAAGLPARPREAMPPAVPGPAPIEKAAILLTAIGPDLAAGVLRDVSPANLRRFGAATAGLGRVSQETLDGVILEFLQALTVGADLEGGAEAARRLLAGILDEGQIAELLGERRAPQLSVWDRLAAAPVEAVAAFLGAEHPQAAAVVLGELKPDAAAGVLEGLEQDFAREVVLRLSRVPALPREVREALQAGIERHFLAGLERSAAVRQPAELIAGLMNNISTEAREGFLAHLGGALPALAQDVQRTMFTFDDIAARIAGRDIPDLVRALPEETLLPALKLGEGAGSPSVAFILANLPRRLAERYREDLAQMEEVSRKEGEAAQIALARLVLARRSEGALSFVEPEGG